MLDTSENGRSYLGTKCRILSKCRNLALQYLDDKYLPLMFLCKYSSVTFSVKIQESQKVIAMKKSKTASSLKIRNTDGIALPGFHGGAYLNSKPTSVKLIQLSSQNVCFSFMIPYSVEDGGGGRYVIMI